MTATLCRFVVGYLFLAFISGSAQAKKFDSTAQDASGPLLRLVADPGFRITKNFSGIQDPQEDIDLLLALYYGMERNHGTGLEDNPSPAREGDRENDGELHFYLSLAETAWPDRGLAGRWRVDGSTQLAAAATSPGQSLSDATGPGGRGSHPTRFSPPAAGMTETAPATYEKAPVPLLGSPIIVHLNQPFVPIPPGAASKGHPAPSKSPQPEQLPKIPGPAPMALAGPAPELREVTLDLPIKKHPPVKKQVPELHNGKKEKVRVGDGLGDIVVDTGSPVYTGSPVDIGTVIDIGAVIDTGAVEQPVPAPEPATLLLLAAGVAGMVCNGLRGSRNTAGKGDRRPGEVR